MDLAGEVCESFVFQIITIRRKFETLKGGETMTDREKELEEKIKKLEEENEKLRKRVIELAEIK